jgi:hypothetical protein
VVINRQLRAHDEHGSHDAFINAAQLGANLESTAPNRFGARFEGAQFKVREERFPWGLGAILALLIVGGVGFWLGSSSVAPVIVTVPAPAPVAPVAPVYPTYAPQGAGGFPFFGLIFGLIFFVVIFKLIRRAAWSAGHGSYGSQGYGGPGYGGHGYGRRGGHRNHGDRGWYDASAGQARDPNSSGSTWGPRWSQEPQTQGNEPPDDLLSV